MTWPIPRCEAELLAVAGDDAGAFLAAVLQGVQPEVSQVRRFRMTVDAENSTHGGTSLGRRGARPCHGFHGSASLLTERRGFVRAAGLCARPRSARVEP